MIIPVQDIIKFWFESVADDTVIAKKENPFRKWFVSSKSFDEEIRLNFEDFLLGLSKNITDYQNHSVEERLAVILLCDQFSRNLFRNTPQMYEWDRLAQELALSGIKGSDYKSLNYLQRIFFYMPLMHAEDVKLQNLSLEYFDELLADVAQTYPHNESYYRGQRDYAFKYQNIVMKFGRFPHRNTILSRTSTLEELNFLKKR